MDPAPNFPVCRILLPSILAAPLFLSSLAVVVFIAALMDLDKGSSAASDCLDAPRRASAAKLAQSCRGY
jgi:hypothetical protein